MPFLYSHRQTSETDPPILPAGIQWMFSFPGENVKQMALPDVNDNIPTLQTNADLQASHTDDQFLR